MKKLPYTKYINEIFDSIKGLLPINKNPEVAFGEGNSLDVFSGSDRDYAIIRNENAVMFVGLIQEYSDLFQVDKELVTLQNSKIYKGEVKYRHSCYPKNIHRWLHGTISRKKLCRIEFVVMAYCWASGWKESARNPKSSSVIEVLKDISFRYCDNILEDDNLLVCLWKACESAYINSIK